MEETTQNTHTYTSSLEDEALSLSPEDDDYTEKLTAICRQFRSPELLLNAFLQQHGYQGKIDDTMARNAYIRKRFKDADIPLMRDTDQWFSRPAFMSREAAFRMCFAFSLGLDGSEDFFRRVCLSRGFDCHRMKEAVYYFCLKKNLSWQSAQDIYKQVHEPKETEAGGEVMYTGSILAILNQINTPNELIDWLNANASAFGVHHVTAIHMLENLWHRIECLAYEEGKQIETGTGDDAPVTAGKEDSIWNIYAQIMGLDQLQAKKFAETRSLKKCLLDNRVMHREAEDAFPDREGIQKVLDHRPMSDKRVRKLLILLTFYAFWAEASVKNETDDHDSMRCFCQLNQSLLDAGFPALYYGNPYDWIFLWCLKQENPLAEFRYYMQEVLAVDSERKPDPDHGPLQ